MTSQHLDVIIIKMRTTINLPDDVYEIGRSLARSKNIPLGEALAGLARKGIYPTPRIDASASFPRFSIPDDAPPITLEQTLTAEDEVPGRRGMEVRGVDLSMKTVRRIS